MATWFPWDGGNFWLNSAFQKVRGAGGCLLGPLPPASASAGPRCRFAAVGEMLSNTIRFEGPSRSAPLISTSAPGNRGSSVALDESAATGLGFDYMLGNVVGPNRIVNCNPTTVHVKATTLLVTKLCPLSRKRTVSDNDDAS